MTQDRSDDGATRDELDSSTPPAKERIPGGQPAESVGDRPNVSTVKPEEYPAANRRDARADR